MLLAIFASDFFDTWEAAPLWSEPESLEPESDAWPAQAVTRASVTATPARDRRERVDRLNRGNIGLRSHTTGDTTDPLRLTTAP